MTEEGKERSKEVGQWVAVEDLEVAVVAASKMLYIGSARAYWDKPE